MEKPPDDSIETGHNKSLIEAEDTPDQVCSPKECTKTPELYVASLKCSACDRPVHYRCTGLPHYMIEFFTKKYGGNNASGAVKIASLCLKKSKKQLGTVKII